MTRPSSATYGWIDDSVLAEGACITAVPDVSVEEALARLGIDPARTVDLIEALEGASAGVVRTAGGVVIVEPNGFQGSQEQVLARLAGGASAASMFWNVNALNAFTWVRGGQVVASVDLHDAEKADDAETSDALELTADLHELWRSAAERETDPWAAGLAMVEVATGIEIPHEVASLSTFYVLDDIPAEDDRSFDEPAPDHYPARTAGLAAMRTMLHRITDLRDKPVPLETLATLALAVEAAGTPAAVFKKAVWAHGWPTSNGASGASLFEIGNENIHHATEPDDRREKPTAGGIFTRIVELDRPRTIRWAWNWVVPDPDGYARWTSRRLLADDSFVTLTLVKSSSRGEEPRTRIELEHRGVPQEWVADLHRLWVWHLEQLVSDRSYW